MRKAPKSRRKLNSLFRAGTLIKYKKGEVIIRPEDKPLGVYLVESGYVKSYSISKTGQVSIRVIKKKNDILPIVWALGGVTRDVFMETMNDVIVYRISRAEFIKFINENPDILRCLIKEMINLYSIYDIRIGSLEYRYAYDRIIAQLLLLADQFGKKHSNGEILIDLPLRHNDIADSVNATRETVSRELAKIERRKLIRYENRQIVIKSRTALEKEL